MTQQIAVRLPDELIRFIDDAIENGTATSRAAMVIRALDRERRRTIAERDAEILARLTPGSADDLDQLAQYAAGQTIDDLD